MDNSFSFTTPQLLEPPTLGPPQCPLIDPYINASSLHYFSGDCPLDELPIKTNPLLRIPTLDTFLDLAKKYNRNVIFDLYLPHVQHPYRERYLQQTFHTIAGSKIPLHKVNSKCTCHKLCILPCMDTMTIMALTGMTVQHQYTIIDFLNL